MNNSIFDLFNFDFSDLLEKFNSLKEDAANKYNDFVNNKVNKYDLADNQSYQEFIEDAAKLRNELEQNENAFFNKYLIDLLDKFVEKAAKYHAERQNENLNKQLSNDRNANVNDIIRTEVDRSVNENHGKLNHGVGVSDDKEEREDFIWPSSQLTSKQRRNVHKLVDEYVDTMIVPYLSEDYNEKKVSDMASGLFEFAAWILTKEED